MKGSLLAALLSTALPAFAEPVPSDPSFEKFERYLEKGELDSARKALELGLRRVPDYVGGWANLGKLLLLQKDYQGASEAYLQALELDPGHFVSMNGLGAAMLGLERGQEAVEWFLRSVETEPSYLPPLLNLARFSWERGDVALAIKYYSLALQVDPNAREPALALAELHVLADLPDKAYRWLDPLLERNPEDLEALELKGRALLGQGLPLRALDPLLTAKYLDPQRADVQRLVGLSCTLTSQWGCAEDAYRAAIVLVPEDAELHLELGRVYNLAGSETWDRALWHFEKSAGLDPALAAPWFERASIEEELGKRQEAMAHYGEAIAREPRHCPSLSNLARIEKNAGDPAAAELLLDQCLAAEPGFVLALLNRGWIRAEAGMCDGARADLQAVAQRQDVWGEQARQLLEKCP